MRPLKVLSTMLIAAFALLAGLFTALLIAAGGAVVYLFRRVFGSSKTSPASREPAQRFSGGRSNHDVIEVTATEVPADPPAR